MIKIEVQPAIELYHRDGMPIDEALEKLQNKIRNFAKQDIETRIAVLYRTYYMRAVLYTKDPGEEKLHTRRFYWVGGWRNS